MSFGFAAAITFPNAFVRGSGWGRLAGAVVAGWNCGAVNVCGSVMLLMPAFSAFESIRHWRSPLP